MEEKHIPLQFLSSTHHNVECGQNLIFHIKQTGGVDARIACNNNNYNGDWLIGTRE